MNNNPQNANYWFNDFIITIGSAVVKTTQKHLMRIYSGLMLCLHPTTIYSWIRASRCEETFQTNYYQLKRIVHQKDKLEKVQRAWTIKQVASLLSECIRLYIVGDDTQTNHPGPKILGADWMKDSTPQATDSKKCRGHSWVVVMLLHEHPRW